MNNLKKQISLKIVEAIVLVLIMMDWENIKKGAIDAFSERQNSEISR